MTSSLQLRIDGASVWVVPSIHFRLAFADAVNLICSTEKPDAIAVELGPETAAAATGWLRELGAGRGSFRLPCMLGLLKSNRRIRPSRRVAATLLQEWTGKELHELPPDILHEYLGYSPVSLLPLSCTDSIVEAMRCGLELGVPVYGIDLEETAERRQNAVMLQDPWLALEALEPYVSRNSAFAEQQRDHEIDERREIVMAARLKGLAKSHRRIVFVCGLAHWRQLLARIQSRELEAVPYPGEQGAGTQTFQRVVMHPLLAIYHVDTYPRFSGVYEARRANARTGREELSPTDWQGVFPRMLGKVYRQQFTSTSSGEQLDRALEDLEAKEDFEQLLRNFCTVRQRLIPDLFSVLTVAHGVMSESFQNTLAEVVMDTQWARPDDYPGVPRLDPAPLLSHHTLRAELVDNDGPASEAFYVQSLPGRASLPMNIPITWRSPDMPPPHVDPPPDDAKETWVPTEDLINALLFRAVRIARDPGGGANPEPFAGSLLDGLDLKNTLRSAARGEDQIFVRAERRQRVASPDDDIDGFPVVWIFRLLNTDWTWAYSMDDLDGLADGPLSEAWEQAGLPTQGAMFTALAAVTLPSSRPDEKLSTPTYRVTNDTIIGKLSYWPQCCKRRTAEWAVETRLKRNPVIRYSGKSYFDELCDFYREKFGFEVGAWPWHVTMIRMAIPMARKAVTVVAPDGYVIPRFVQQEAALRGISIRLVPLSFFDFKLLRRISHVVWLPVLERKFDEKEQIDFPVFAPHVERHFNERIDAFRGLLPAKWH